MTNWDIYTRLSSVFSPAAPIQSKALFAGRQVQIADLIDVISQAGQHAVLYGERGVGKTSLAAVLSEVLTGPRGFVTARVNCDMSDTFSSVWRKALGEIQFVSQKPGLGFNAETRQILVTAADSLPDDELTPSNIQHLLRRFDAIGTNVVIFLDEFDRLPRGEATRFADTIKSLSDHLVHATIVIVGVADNVDQLIEDHRSVERALVQVRLPRMSIDELAQIVTLGLESISMTIEPEGVDRITQMSLGLPHYTHLIALAAGRVAVGYDSSHVDVTTVDEAIDNALDRAQQSVVGAYVAATASARQTLYEHVVLACALAPVDDLGSFRPIDVREPLRAILNDPTLDVSKYSRHLHDLSEGERGPLLQRRGQPRRFRFRFLNPLVQPYVIMRGLAHGRVDGDLLARFARRVDP